MNTINSHQAYLYMSFLYDDIHIHKILSCFPNQLVISFHLSTWKFNCIFPFCSNSISDERPTSTILLHLRRVNCVHLCLQRGILYFLGAFYMLFSITIYFFVSSKCCKEIVVICFSLQLKIQISEISKQIFFDWPKPIF